MTMRSMPPASSHLAERPVPAPPPIIGLARLFHRLELGQNRLALESRHQALLSRRGAGGQESRCRRRDEGVVVDIRLNSLDAPLRGLADSLFQRLEQGGVGLRIVKRLAWGVKGRDASLRQEEPHRTFHLVDARAHPFANGAVLLRRGPHQRHVGIVDHEPARAEFVRHRVARPEIHHVHRADRADPWQARADRGAETIAVRGENAADQHVGDLRRRQIDEACEHP